jgi:ferredoxin
MEPQQSAPPRQAVIAVEALDDLIGALATAGYRPVGPVARDGAIVLDDLRSAADLPHGWGVDSAPGRYRLTRREDGAVFGHSSGPQSWKQYLHPARRKLWDADRDANGSDGFTVTPAPADSDRYAFIGVRPCDLAAVRILGRVLSGGRRSAPDGDGTRWRRDVFVVAVDCTEPGGTCFCASMGTGPGCSGRTGEFDLALVELAGDIAGPGGHRFLVTVGSDRGGWILDAVPHGPVDETTVQAARVAVDAASGKMGRTLPDTDIRALLVTSRDAERWNDVASRCLTCGNCTMVCPTCFCTSTEDVTDLTGDHAERWESWDSCFDIDYSHIHGGAVRTSASSRYRQWLSHKFGTWHDQFGESGCVGCGRCIAWCPAGIDVTAELAALAAESAEPAESAEAASEVSP